MKSSNELETQPRVPKLPQIEKEVSSDDESSADEEPVAVTQPKVQAKRISFDVSNSYKQPESEVLDKAVLDDMKRQQSLQKLKDMHKAKKDAIKNALLSIDSTEPRNNKIVFEKPEPIVKKAEIDTKKQHVLFDDDDGDAEVAPESFKLKKQFEGKKGEKLFELQTKFHNDSRFKMDEKFADDADEFVDKKKVYARAELKERKRLRKEMANWDQDEMKEERDHQLNILESITGQWTGIQTNSHLQQQPHKGMLRFDPSKKSHQKYFDTVKGDDQDVPSDDDKRLDDSQIIEKVGDERYFEVSESLANAFNEPSSNSFSIFGMLGINHADEVEVKDNKHEEPELKPIKMSTKIQAIQLNQARFKYDSSDTDEDAEKEKSKKKIVKKEQMKKSKDGKYSKAGVWRYNFFVCDGDKRLQEAFTFLKKSDYIQPEALQEKRKKLKKVIQTQVRKARQDKEKSSKKRKV